MITGARNHIDVAAPPVAPGGYLAGAAVVDVNEGDHSLMGIEYESIACFGDVGPFVGDWCSTLIGTPNCANGTWTPAPNAKVFNPAQAVYQGDPFAVYQGVECGLQSMEDTLAQARAAYAYGERLGVDTALSAFVAASPGISDLGATKLAPSVIIGRLEAALAGEYGGTPLLAFSIEDIPALCQRNLVSVNIDGTFTTCQGSTVIGVAGQPAGTVYAMGRMVLVRGPLNTIVTAPQQIPCANGTTISLPSRALAERIYVPVIECRAFKGMMQPCDCTSTAAVGTTNPEPPTNPPELSYMSATSVSVGAPDFTLHVHGEALTDDTDVVVNGVHYPTAFIDDHELEIVVHPSINVPGAYTVQLQNPQGTSATTLTFTFTP